MKNRFEDLMDSVDDRYLCETAEMLSGGKKKHFSAKKITVIAVAAALMLTAAISVSALPDVQSLFRKPTPDDAKKHAEVIGAAGDDETFFVEKFPGFTDPVPYDVSDDRISVELKSVIYTGNELGVMLDIIASPEAEIEADAGLNFPLILTRTDLEIEPIFNFDLTGIGITPMTETPLYRNPDSRTYRYCVMFPDTVVKRADDSTVISCAYTFSSFNFDGCTDFLLGIGAINVRDPNGVVPEGGGSVRYRTVDGAWTFRFSVENPAEAARAECDLPISCVDDSVCKLTSVSVTPLSLSFGAKFDQTNDDIFDRKLRVICGDRILSGQRGWANSDGSVYHCHTEFGELLRLEDITGIMIGTDVFNFVWDENGGFTVVPAD